MNLPMAQKERQRLETPFKNYKWRLLARSVSLALLGVAIVTFPGRASENSHHLPATLEPEFDAVPFEGDHYVPASVQSTYGAIPPDASADAILLIFIHGSGAEFTPDQCKRDNGVPKVIRELEGRRLAGKKVIVYAFCTPSRVGEYNHNSRTGEPKVVKRARDIEELVGRFTAAGLPSSNIFLIGHGAGAWASLLVERRGNVDINAVIGFGPAFAGRKVTRSEGWWDLHRKQSEYLRTAPRLDAMVFAFEGDRYSDISELKSTFSATGVKFVPVTEEAGKKANCNLVADRNGAYTKCFEQFAGPRIGAFIEERLGNTAPILAKEHDSARLPETSANDAVSPNLQKSLRETDKLVSTAVTPDDPSDAILLVYSAGSGPEFVPDECSPDKDVPDLVRSMEERRIAGRPVRVYVFCGPSRIGKYVHELRSGEPKVVKRARDIEDLVDSFTAAGLPSRNVFLVGHSAGAWASLLVARRGKVDVNGVIAFAPTFAGPVETRPKGWKDIHRKQSEFLRTAARLDALVFAFERDAYSEISDLGSALSAPGVTFVPVTRTVGNNDDCGKAAFHRGAFTDCFESFAGSRIKSFIEQRLRDMGTASAPADNRMSLRLNESAARGRP